MLDRSVPPFVRQMREMAELFRAEQPEIDRMEADLEELLKQFYIKSATYALDNWEEEFSLPRDSGLTLRQRRERILAKLNSSVPATVKMLENLVLQTLSAKAVTIVERPAQYHFDIYVNTDYLIDTLAVADDAVRRARPAHLSYHFINRLIRESGSRIYVGIAGGYIGIRKGVVEDAVLFNEYRKNLPGEG